MSFETDLQDARSGFVADPPGDASSVLVAFGGMRGGMGIPPYEFFRVTEGLASAVGDRATRVVTTGNSAGGFGCHGHRLDARHAQRVAGLPGVSLHRYDEGGHRLVGVLRDRGDLRRIMEGALRGDG